MNFYRKTLNSKSLEHILNLPPELRNTDVEVIILPAEEKSIDKPKKPYKKYVGKLDDDSHKEITETLNDSEVEQIESKSMRRALKRFTGVDDLKELHSDSFKVHEREDLYDR